MVSSESTKFKGVSAGLGSLLLGVYSVGIVASGLYFNWTYARDHGFVKWATLGLVVPTAKAVVWPYFAISAVSQRGNALPSEFAKDRERLTSAFAAFGTVSDLTEAPSGQPSFQMPKEREDSVRQMLTLGLANADLVSDRFLDWLEPSMKHYLHDFFLRGQRLYLKGLNSGDGVKQLEGVRLISRWHSEYWATHQKAVTSKAFGP